MVMHARKLPRLNDGYYDRHQGHSYQNQNSRHNSSKNNYSNRYNHDRSSRCNSNGRFDSPEELSPPRNRSYSSKSSYTQRYENDKDRYDKERDRYDRERDRSSRYDRDREKDSRYERDRDTKYDRDREFKYDRERDTKYEKEREYKYEKEKDIRYRSSKEKYYSEYEKSPKDKRSVNKDSKDYNHQNHSDRNLAEKLKMSNISVPGGIVPVSPTTPPTPVAPKPVSAPLPDVSTPVTSTVAQSFNTTSNVVVSSVQSITPPAVVSSVNAPVPLPINNNTKNSIAIVPSISSLVSNSVPISSGTVSCSTNIAATKESAIPKKLTNDHSEPMIREKRDENNRLIRVGEWSEHLSNTTGRYYYFHIRTKECQWHKPLEWLEREAFYQSQTANSVKQESEKHSIEPSSTLIKNSSSKPDSKIPITCSLLNDVQSQDMEISSTSSSPSDSRNDVQDPRLSCDVNNRLPSTSPVQFCGGTNSSVQGPSPSPSPQVLLSTTPSAIISRTTSNSKNEPPSSASSSSSVPSTPNRRLSLTNMKIDPPESTAEPGPPTPTHSETQDASNVDSRKGSPVNNTISCLSNITSLPSATSSVQTSHLNIQFTPSLSQYVREDLTSHIRNWPSESIEKQANKIKEDRYILYHSVIAKVDYELKALRSKARVSEIMNNVAEQRFLMTEETIKHLEKLRPPVSILEECQQKREND